MERTGVPIGAAVVAANGEALGTVHTSHAHFFVLEGSEGASAIDYEVPIHAVAGIEGGRVLLTVNREALNPVPAEQQSAAHRLHQEE